MQMHVSNYDETQLVEHENPEAGIVLCSDKNDAMVKTTLRGRGSIYPARYLPTEEELLSKRARERELAQRQLLRAAEDQKPEAET